MQIDQTSDGELLELTVAGVLDNESSTYFQSAIEDYIRDGWHRIVVHMQGVSYISSAGINVLVTTRKRLERLQGRFGIFDVTSEVERVLSQTRLLDVLLCDPDELRGTPSVGDYTRSLSSRIAREDGLDLQIFGLDEEASSRCRVIGDPRPLFESSFTPEQCCSVEFPETSFAIGLGGLGEDFASSSSRFGEFLAVSGVVAQSAQSRRQLPDYSLSSEDFTPRAQVLYGMRCEGAFTELIRFQPAEAGAPVKASAIIGQCLRQTDATLAGIVILAETAGLLGAHLRRSPAEAAAGIPRRFEFPEIRDWLSFSPERVYSRNLALIVGVAKRRGSDPSLAALDDLLRPLSENGDLSGHFHAAVFPYRPLKKRTLDLHASVREQFESGGIQDVLHLLRDDRPNAGVGESELIGGACWVSPISDVIVEGVSE